MTSPVIEVVRYETRFSGPLAFRVMVYQVRGRADLCEARMLVADEMAVVDRALLDLAWASLSR